MLVVVVVVVVVVVMLTHGKTSRYACAMARWIFLRFSKWPRQLENR